MMKSKTMKRIRNIIMGATVVIGFLLWLVIPDEFKNTSFFHVGTGESGTKAWALILLLLPLFALIPNKEENEVHTKDPAEREKLMEEFAMREAKRQVIVAILLGITVVSILGFAALFLSLKQ